MSGGMQIFRREALERLSSPEQLDELMVVTDSKAWITLSVLGVGLAVALLWSVFGSIPTSIQGSGVLLREGGIYDIQAGGSGQILTLLTAEDSIVEQGAVIGYIAQPELATRISLQHQSLLVLRGTRDNLVQSEDQDLAITLEVIAQDSVRLTQDINTAQQQVADLAQRLVDIRFARDEGLVTGQAVSSTEQELASAQSNLAQLRTALTQIPSRRIRAVQQRDNAVEGVEQQLQAAVQDSILLAGQLTEANEIRSTHRGRVMQLMVDVGQIVGTGTVVASMELLEQPLQAIIFVPVVGAKARAGLEAHVQPMTVSWEEHGFMVGRVDFVSQSPVTVDRMNRVLKNSILAQGLTQAGDPYLVEVALERGETPTGFRWTSGRGPDSTASIHSGVLASAKIIVESRRPITLVIPALRDFFGF